MLRLLVFFSIFFVGLASSATVALAQDARVIFGEGQEAYNQGDYEKSVSKWNEAYKLDPKPLIQYNLSNAYERLGKLTEAIKAAELYLSTAREDDRARRSDTTARLEKMKRRLEKTGIVISGAPDGSAISIDGQSWGLTPRPDPIRVSPGSHTVELSKDGYRGFTAVVSVSPGQRLGVTASMEQKDGAAPVANVEESATEGPKPQPEADDEFPIWPVSLMAGGGAVAIGGLIVGAIASSTADDSVTGDDDDADSAKTLALVADIMIFGGLAIAAGGVLWYFLDSGEDEATDSVSWGVVPVITPETAGAAAHVRF